MNTHRPRKRFGQNFLTDPRVIDAVIDLIAPQSNDHIVEIGPGRRALTEPLSRHAGHLTVIEIDRDLGVELHRRFGDAPGVDVLVADALAVDFTALAGAGRVRVVGNLPYNISTPIILHLLGHGACISDMTFMLQKEVVDRLAAAPGSGDYGRLSVMVQSACAVDACFEVRPEAFDPIPKVVSRLVRITPQSVELTPAEQAALGDCVRVAFGQRRKTVRNTLGKSYGEVLLRACGIEPSARPADIAVGTYIELARAIAAG